MRAVFCLADVSKSNDDAVWARRDGDEKVIGLFKAGERITRDELTRWNAKNAAINCC